MSKAVVTALTAAALLALDSTAIAAAQSEDVADASVPAASTTREVAEPDEGPGTETLPAERELEYEGPGTDTLPGERGVEYEGPGTDVVPPRAGATYDCRPVDGDVVCDTFGESNEGPGTR